MRWLARLFGRRTDPPPLTPAALPDGWTTSSRRYPAAVLERRQITMAMRFLARDARLNWDAEKRTFTLAAPRDQYRALVPPLREAARAERRLP